MTNPPPLKIVKKIVSYAFDVPSAVPQGSHLGPLLFILFINDIFAVIRHSKLLIFADDATMYKRIETVKDWLIFRVI